jgi:hypothetical protein
VGKTTILSVENQIDQTPFSIAGILNPIDQIDPQWRQVPSG